VPDHSVRLSPGGQVRPGGCGGPRAVESLLARERIEAIIHLAAFALVPSRSLQPQKY